MSAVIMAVVHAVHGHEGEVTGLVQAMQSQGQQLVNEDGTVLLGLDGFALVGVDVEGDGTRVVHVATAERPRRRVRRAG